MAVNKNFVVKNGLEVNANLIVADATTDRVGIGTTAPEHELHVLGGIGATDLVVSGITTVLEEFRVGTAGTVLTVLSTPGIGYSVGVGSSQPEYLLDIRSPVSTGQTALYVQGDVRITGDVNLDDITLDDATIQDLRVQNTLFVGADGGTGVATITTLGVTGVTTTQYLEVTGISTFVGLATFNSGIQVVSGIATLDGYVDINNSVDISTDLNVVGLTTLGGYVDINDSVDISTDLNVVGIVTAGSVSIGATQVISDAFELQNIASLDATTTATIEAAIANAPNTFTDLTVTGISTLGTVLVSSGIVTATTGIVTYYGDGSNLSGIATNLTATIGVGSESTFVGAGVTEIYFATTTGTNVSVVSAGTSATVTITPGVSLGLAIALGG